MKWYSSTLDDLEGQCCNRNCIDCSAFSLATARLFVNFSLLINFFKNTSFSSQVHGIGLSDQPNKRKICKNAINERLQLKYMSARCRHMVRSSALDCWPFKLKLGTPITSVLENIRTNSVLSTFFFCFRVTNQHGTDEQTEAETGKTRNAALY